MKKYLIFYASIIFVGCVIVYLSSTYFGNNPLNKGLMRKKKIVSILPEGWAFFTISAKAPRTYYFKSELNSLVEIDLRNLTFSNALGFSRNNRILNLQFNTIDKKLSENKTRSYYFNAKTLQDCLEKFICDTLEFNTLCFQSKMLPEIAQGKYVIITQSMLAWPLIRKIPDYPSEFQVCAIEVKKL